MSGEFVSHTLDNGLRIVIEVMAGVRSAACGFLARTGSRDEDRALAGASHFLEHMCFKGTHNRTCAQINIAFDEMGAFYNAFTSKERTFYFGWVRHGDLYRQMELLADMMRSAIPPAEFDTEKNVVLEEIAMSNDQITHLAFDFLHEKVFLVDDIGAGVGTVNLDPRSYRMHFEITAIAADRNFAAEVEKMLVADFAAARRMTRAELDAKPLWFRAAARAVYLSSPLQ